MGEADRIDLDEFRLDHDALHRRDWDRAQRLHHPEIEWHDPPEFPDARIHRGREAVRQGVYEATSDITEEWRVEPREFTPVGDKLFVECTMSGKSRQGIEMDFEIFMVWTFRDGLAIRQQQFFDRDRAVEAAGLE
jgi:ketosteroid isomerase-like protein